MVKTIRVDIHKCKLRPEYIEVYGQPSDYEIMCKATQLRAHGQSSLINVEPDENDIGMYWLNDGALRTLGAKRLVNEGNASWIELDAVVTVPIIPIKAFIISLNTTRIKTKEQRCAEAIYLIEQMPLTQGVENRTAPTTGEEIVGRTNAWIGQMVGLPEYAITILRSAFEFKETDPIYFSSLLSSELDSWAEMKRVIDNMKEKKRIQEIETKQAPLYQTPVIPATEPTTEVITGQDGGQIISFDPPMHKQPLVLCPPLQEQTHGPPQPEQPSTLDPPQQQSFKHTLEPRFTQYKRYKFYCWDSITMPHVGSHTAQVAISSPPYWDLKDYLLNSLGNEIFKTDYVKNVAAYFSKEMRRVLKKRGSLFLNCADTIRDGELQTIPQLLLAALLNDGWHLVGEIIWHKPKLPNNKGAGGKIVRLQHNTEVIYHLVQEPIDKVTGECGYDYYPFIEYSEKPIPALVKKPVVKNKDHTKTRKGYINPANGKKFKNRWTEEDGKNAFETFLSRCKGDNEIIGGNGGSRSKEIKDFNPEFEHVAVMSSYLPVIPILECSRRNDLILDVFGGSGTVGLCAAKLDRAAIQFDIDPDNVEHGLGEYADWYKKAYGCEPEHENGNETTLINIKPNQNSSKKAA